METGSKVFYRRILALDRALRRGGRVNFTTLSELPEYEDVSRKTLLRDIEFMRSQGAPIRYNAHRKSYFYPDGTDFYVKAVPLDEGDLFAIAIAERVLDQYRATPLFDRLQKSFEKIRGYLPEKVRVSMPALCGRYDFFFPPAALFPPEVWEAVTRGLAEERVVRMAYTVPGWEKPLERDMNPYRLVNHAGAWYVLGHDHYKDDIRTFALSRISAAEVLDEGFAAPLDFDLDDYMGRHFGIMRGEREQVVKLLFEERHAPYVKERDWHPSQEMKERKDGSVELCLTLNDLTEVERWILSWGGGVRVLSPRSLRDAVRESAAATAKANR